MDNADRAYELQAAEIEAALERHMRSVDGEAHSIYCVDCGHEIQKARRAAVPWAKRCVMCQMDEDRRMATGV